MPTSFAGDERSGVRRTQTQGNPRHRDGASDLGLQDFNLAQNRPPLAVMLIFGGMLSALQNGESLEPMLKALARGFQMGLEDELGSPANSRRARSGRCKSGARSRS
jgi:hypothetical protein